MASDRTAWLGARSVFSSAFLLDIVDRIFYELGTHSGPTKRTTGNNPNPAARVTCSASGARDGQGRSGMRHTHAAPPESIAPKYSEILADLLRESERFPIGER